VRKRFREVDHQPVARDLRHDRGGRDARFQRIPVDDGGVRIVEPEFVAAVDQEVRGAAPLRELRDGLLHRPLGCRKDAMEIDEICLHNTGSVRTVCRDPCEGFFAHVGREYLAVADEAGQGNILGQDAGSRNDRACQSAPAGFINSGGHGGRGRFPRHLTKMK